MPKIQRRALAPSPLFVPSPSPSPSPNPSLTFQTRRPPAPVPAELPPLDDGVVVRDGTRYERGAWSFLEKDVSVVVAFPAEFIPSELAGVAVAATVFAEREGYRWAEFPHPGDGRLRSVIVEGAWIQG